MRRVPALMFDLTASVILLPVAVSAITGAGSDAACQGIPMAIVVEAL